MNRTALPSLHDGSGLRLSRISRRIVRVLTSHCLAIASIVTATLPGSSMALVLGV